MVCISFCLNYALADLQQDVRRRCSLQCSRRPGSLRAPRHWCSSNWLLLPRHWLLHDLLLPGHLHPANNDGTTHDLECTSVLIDPRPGSYLVPRPMARLLLVVSLVCITYACSSDLD